MSLTGDGIVHDIEEEDDCPGGINSVISDGQEVIPGGLKSSPVKEKTRFILSTLHYPSYRPISGLPGPRTACVLEGNFERPAKSYTAIYLLN